MSGSKSESTFDLSLLATIANQDPDSLAEVEAEVLALFDRDAHGLLRYVRSFGLDGHAEDVVQDVFLSLFRHLRLGRSNSNLRGWIFRVAHNLALKERRARRHADLVIDSSPLADTIDGADNPEEQLARRQRWSRLAAVLHALPERDRRCLYLRAEGLRYRDIATALGISLGAVSKSLTRSLARMTRAVER
jgi:RNA polymerase sigma-70 factor, ECF subfamily